MQGGLRREEGVNQPIQKDTGGKTVLRQVWTSFVKARLNCSISSQFPFYFNEIRKLFRGYGRYECL